MSRPQRAAFAVFTGLSVRVHQLPKTSLTPRRLPARPSLTATRASQHQQTDPAPRKEDSAQPAPRGKTLLLIGLGNVGPRYDNTRHNIGFALVNEFTRRNNGTFKTEKRFQADVAKVQLADHTVHIVKPRTFMNNSGAAVKAVQSYYNVATNALLVVADDMSLEVGRIRLRGKGSAGGHNGLKSVQKNVGTMEYARLKVGVGAPGGAAEWKDFVLGSFTRGEKAVLEEVTWDVMDVLEHWVQESDLNRVINRMGMAQQAKNR